MDRSKLSLRNAVLVLLLFSISVVILYFAKPFLVPLCLAGVLAMLLLKICAKLERRGVKRGVAALMGVLLLVLAFAVIVVLIGWQLSGFTENMGELKRQSLSLLEIVPFVGNLLGTSFTVLAVAAQGGGTELILGVIVVYMVVQFVQTYVLEPLVVGSEVRINPLFTIIALVAGELLWGIAGMVLAIPLMGVLRIVFDHIPPLKPYAYLIGSDSRDRTSLLDKVKGWFEKKSKQGN